MTCIVGIETSRGTVILGADSAVTAGHGRQMGIGDPKVFKLAEGLAVGVCGMPKVITQLRDGVDWPTFNLRREKGVRELMARKVLPTIVKTLRAGECLDGNGRLPGELLVACHGSLFLVDTAFQTLRIHDGEAAVGSGGPYARGSLHSTSHTGESPEARVRQALEAACAGNAGCRPPFTLLEV